MDLAQSNEFHMRLDCAREEVLDSELQLHATKNEISQVLDAAEHLAVEACTLGLRRGELEQDEAALVESEALAVQGKVLAEKRLMDVGGFECVVRILRKTLQKAKLELLDTEDETRSIAREEEQLRAELVSLTANLKFTKLNVMRLQEECATAATNKRDTDSKLRQLSMFLHKAITTSMPDLDDVRPASPAPIALQLPASPDVTTASSSVASTPIVSGGKKASNRRVNAPGSDASLSHSLRESAAMDKYRRVEKPRREEQAQHVEANEIRITQQGKVRNYISYANGLFAVRFFALSMLFSLGLLRVSDVKCCRFARRFGQEKSERGVMLKAMGNAISKAVTVAEILKHRVAHLHQVTQISSIETVDVYEPLEEGLDRIETKRHIPGISIQLSLDELDRDDPGYQSPIPVDQVSPSSFSYHDDREYRKSRGHGKRASGRSGGRGGAAVGPPASAVADAVAAAAIGAEEERDAMRTEEALGGHQTPGEDEEKTTAAHGKRSRGRGRGRGGSNGGRGGRKARGESPTLADTSSESVPSAEAESESAAKQQVDGEGVPKSSGRKSNRGRKPAKREVSGEGYSDESKPPAEEDEARDNDRMMGRGGRGGRGRHSGRGRSRGRGRGRGGRGDDKGHDGAPAATAAAAIEVVAAIE
ncbi:hypothetical protein BBJ28_00011767 [Nothophytophthora sp. Chile5]|nr:hypothetical protein BBJ28_00011767 [Nothophytophthora sp. Chile5]